MKPASSASNNDKFLHDFPLYAFNQVSENVEATEQKRSSFQKFIVKNIPNFLTGYAYSIGCLISNQ